MGGLRVDAKPMLEKLPGGGGEHFYLTNQGNLNYFDKKPAGRMHPWPMHPDCEKPFGPVLQHHFRLNPVTLPGGKRPIKLRGWRCASQHAVWMRSAEVDALFRAKTLRV